MSYIENLEKLAKQPFRRDSWTNFFTGVGNSGIDKRMNTVFNPNPGLTEDELNAIYRNEGMGRRIIEVLTEDMVRKWFKIDADTNGDMEREFKKFRGRKQIEEGIRWALLHGGAVGILGITDGGMYEDPVDESNIDEVTHIHIFDRWRSIWVTADLYNDPYNPKFGTPEFYTIFPINPAMSPGAAYANVVTKGSPSTTKNRGTSVGDQPILNNLKGNVAPLVGAFRVHETRVLRFDGVLIPLKERIRNRYWNDSYLQSCFERIRGLGESYASIETIIQEFIIGTLTIKDLAAMIATGKEGLALKRLDILDRSKHVMNTVMIDENEEYERKPATVTGLDSLVQSLVLGISAASGIPVTVLMGQSPAGLNATGASDIRRYYDKIAGMQQSMIQEPLEKLCKYVMLSKKSRFKGKELDDWSIIFPSLWALTEVEQAEVRLKMAQADGLYLDRNVLSQPEVSGSRFGGEMYSFETSLSDQRDEKGWLDSSVVRKMEEMQAMKQEFKTVGASKSDIKDGGEPNTKQKGVASVQRNQEGNTVK